MLTGPPSTKESYTGSCDPNELPHWPQVGDRVAEGKAVTAIASSRS